MKTTLTTFILSTLLLVGCMDNSSNLISPGVEINQESNSPNWVKIPGDVGQGFSVETEYSAEKLIKVKRRRIKLKVRIHQRRSASSEIIFEVQAKVKVEKHSFPDDEEILFTITMDPEMLT